SYMYRAMSSLEKGLFCHAYITDCKGKTLFDKGMMDCSDPCLVTKRDDIPDDGPYCSHLIVHEDLSTPGQAKYLKFEANECAQIDGNFKSWTFKEVACPKTYPKACKPIKIH
ncbi:6886_t:CDS:1, partial [Funneliformis mosseae]